MKKLLAIECAVILALALTGGAPSPTPTPPQQQHTPPNTTTTAPQTPVPNATPTPRACRCQADGGSVENLKADIGEAPHVAPPPAAAPAPGVYLGAVRIGFKLLAARAWTIGEGAPIDINRQTIVSASFTGNAYNVQIERWNRHERKFVEADRRAEQQTCQCPGEVKFDGDSEAYVVKLYVSNAYFNRYWTTNPGPTEVHIHLRVSVDDHIDPCHFHRNNYILLAAVFRKDSSGRWFMDDVERV